MSSLSVVGLSGNITSPSKTRSFVATALDLVSARFEADTELVDIVDFGPDLALARRLSDLPEAARARISRMLDADALVVATPVYKGSYPGLFKHLIDLLDTAAFLHKPVLIGSVGGGDRHALAVEHQLRPLFAFFEARVLGTAVHVSDKDFSDGVLTSPPARERLLRAVSEFDLIFPQARRTAYAGPVAFQPLNHARLAGGSSL